MPAYFGSQKLGEFYFGGNKIASAYFGSNLVYTSKLPHYLTLQTDGHGTVSASNTSGFEGDTSTLSTTPNTNYVFSAYTVTGGTINGNTFTFSDNDATAKAWIKTNTSYTIYADTLTNNLTTFFIIDNNPFGFVLDTCKFIINNQKQSSKQASSFLCKITTSLQDLQSGVNTIQSIAVYTNGISHKKEWYITYINEE